MRAIIYRKDEEKFGPIARFVSEGVMQDGLVVYYYLGDVSVLREGLSRYGFDARQHLMERSLRLVPFSSLYQSEGVLDEEAAIRYCQGLVEEARALGKRSLKVIIDYETHFGRPYSRFIGHLADPRWTSPDHYVNILMAFSEGAFQSRDTVLDLKSKIDTTDLSDVVDTFSRTMGLLHSEISGKKILLEYEPLSDYERVVKSLLAESSSNFERSVLFTRKDSPLFSLVGKQPGGKIFILTSRVSYPKIEEDRVMLPSYDSSLLLDALNKTIQVYAGASFNIVFDSISHHIFTLGPDRSLSLVRQSLELMVSDKITAVFLLNIGAHDQKTVSMFENLFDMELVCSAGARVPVVKRRLSISVES